MSDLWLNDFTIPGQTFESEPNCTRSTLLQDMGKCQTTIKPEQHSMAWSTMGSNLELSNPLNMFYELPPTFKGNFCSINKEKMSVCHSYEWMILMIPAESHRLVFEACVLIIGAVTVAEEEFAKTYAELTDFDELDIFGYSLGQLIDIVGTVLVPELALRVKNLAIACFKAQTRHENPEMDMQLHNYMSLKVSYDRYLRYRNSDGFFEGGLLCALASCGESGSNLTVGITGDVIECCILNHDTHGVARHFPEEDIANVHRYLGGDLSQSMHRAFKRSIAVLRRVREDESIAPGLKRVACIYASSYHNFNYTVTRYGLGMPFSIATELLLKEKNPEDYVEGVHYVKIDRGQSFAELDAKAKRMHYN